MRIIQVLYYLVFLALLWMPLGNAEAKDLCKTFDRWSAWIQDTSGVKYGYYLPEEFFSGTSFGASIPGYAGDHVKIPYFFFRDTACITDEFEISVEVLTYYIQYDGNNYGGRVIFGIDIEGEPDNPFLKNSNGTFPAEVHDDVIEENYNPALRYTGYSISTIGFRYRDGVLEYLRNGYAYQTQKIDICRIINPYVYWDYSGGTVVSMTYKDVTNGTVYYEDFSDCNNMQVFAECAPEPVVELSADYILPTCTDSTLRLFATSNLLKEFYWIGPDGYESDEQNPTIEKATNKMSGRYTVWGKYSRCSEPVAYSFDVDIPEKMYVDTVINVEFCEIDSLVIGNKVYKESGSYTDTLKSVEGCDSIIVLNITKRYTEAFLFDTICYGGSYALGGNVYGEPGVYEIVLKNGNYQKCDSVIYLNLHVMPKTQRSEVFHEICFGESIIVGNGIKVSSDTVVFDTVKGRLSCDSIIVSHIIKRNPIEERYEDTLFFCAGGSVSVGDSVYYDDVVHTDTVVSDRGCVILLHTPVSAVYRFPLPDTLTEKACVGVPVRVELPFVEGAEYSWKPSVGVDDAFSNKAVVDVRNPVVYSVVVKQDFCFDTVYVRFSVGEKPEIVDIQKTVGLNELVVLEANKGVPPYLFAIDSLDFQPDPLFSNVSAGVHFAYVKDANNCVDSTYFWVFVPVYPEDVMTPNGDGIKDVWEIKNIEYHNQYKITIYDRFGKLLVEYVNEYPGWDGIYNGNPMPSTDYWYVIDLEFIDEQIIGHFTLLRN